jgi:predicted DNA-binding protein (UPF0278 family)
MFNPLLEDLTVLKDAEIEGKINELSRKYTIAARTGMNDVLPQIAVILEALRMEMSKRQAQSLKKATKNSNKDLDDLIKVN